MEMCRFGGFDEVEYRKVVAALERVQIRISEDSSDLVPSSSCIMHVVSLND